jgi:geranylgeranyl diphosphate synthase type II
VLVLAGCELAGGDVQEAMPYAAAVEFIHTYSLIHDDLPAMDDDDLRRGRPSCHKAFGEGLAILAGDGLLNAAYEVMAADMIRFAPKAGSLSDVDAGIALVRRVRAFALLAEGAGCRGMVGGQAADIAAAEAGRLPVGAERDFIHSGKTAAMIRTAVMVGASIGGADDRMLGALAAYGEALGLAFQAADDLLDEKADCAAGVLHTAEDSEERGRLMALTGQAVAALAGIPATNVGFLVDLAQGLALRKK